MSKSIGIAIATALLAGLSACAPMQTSQSSDGALQVATPRANPTDLLGRWKVDLRPTPGAPDYYQSFEVTEISGKSFKGNFYGTPITEGRINVDWGAVRFAFVTEDQSGPYHHSGVLRGGRIEGLTNSMGRGFLAYWSAVRQ